MSLAEYRTLQRSKGLTLYTCKHVNPVDLEYLEALRDVGGVHRQTTSSGHEPHEEYALFVAERLENLPEPLDEVMSLINLSVPTVNTRLLLLLHRLIDSTDILQ